MSGVLDVSIKGKARQVRAVPLRGVQVVYHGHWLRTARIFDHYWLEAESLPPPGIIISDLAAREDVPDIFTFAQRAPHSAPEYNYLLEMDNCAALPLTTYENWFQKQIPSTTQRSIRASEKRGIVVRVCDYNDAYVAGIKSIYDETPLRAGRRFWHFGKDIETVRRENGTYHDRSTYVAAYREGEMVGYLKLVWDKKTAAIMQILSKVALRDCRPNNAMLAEAVRLCCARSIDYLLYERFDYGKKAGDSLTRFKQNNGFRKMEIPRYYVPMTTKGRIAVRLGLHKSLKDRLPEWAAGHLRDLRARWQERALLRGQ